MTTVRLRVVIAVSCLVLVPLAGSAGTPEPTRGQIQRPNLQTSVGAESALLTRALQAGWSYSNAAGAYLVRQLFEATCADPAHPGARTPSLQAFSANITYPAIKIDNGRCTLAYSGDYDWIATTSARATHGSLDGSTAACSVTAQRVNNVLHVGVNGSLSIPVGSNPPVVVRFASQAAVPPGQPMPVTFTLSAPRLSIQGCTDLQPRYAGAQYPAPATVTFTPAAAAR